MKKKEEKNRPEFVSKLGNIEVSVWANEHEGKTLFNSTLSVRYRDAKGEYQTGRSYSERDLACLAACISDTISELQRRKRAA